MLRRLIMLMMSATFVGGMKEKDFKPCNGFCIHFIVIICYT